MKSYDYLTVNYQSLLDLQFMEGTGTLTLDQSKTYKEATLNGVPIWRALANDLMTLDFAPTNPDYLLLTAAITADLGFTTSDFSGLAWFRPHATGNRYIFNKSDAASGWYFYIDSDSAMRFVTCQAGPTIQSSIGAPLTLNTWQLVAFVRDGAVAEIYTNGVKCTQTNGTHVNPAASAGLDFYIGSTNLAAAGWLDGDLWRPRIYPKALTANIIREIYDYERDFLGV